MTVSNYVILILEMTNLITNSFSVIYSLLTALHKLYKC